MFDGNFYRNIYGIHLTCILITGAVLGRHSSSSSALTLTDGLSSNSTFPLPNRMSPSESEHEDCITLRCSEKLLRCCDDGIRRRCCPTTNIQPTFKNPSGDPHWFHRFSLWNMWYFWFIVVLILATCFTGCNYWRRQRRSQHFRLFQRQYTTIAGGGGGGSRRGEAGAQIVIPITMYEVSPDTILRLMRENASYHTTTSTLSSSSGYGGSPRFFGHHHHHQGHHQGEQQQPDRTLQQGPPSYGEVTSKPNMYPPKSDESEPPSYESVSQSQRGETIASQGDDVGAQVDQTSLQQRRLSL